jgi:hypothetical protein
VMKDVDCCNAIHFTSPSSQVLEPDRHRNASVRLRLCLQSNKGNKRHRYSSKHVYYQEAACRDRGIGMREFGNLILLGSKPLPTAKAEVWACKIPPGL